MRLPVVTAAVAVLVTATSARPAAAETEPSPWVSSNFETTWGMTISRDCGYTEPIPGHPGESLWVFCDTGVKDGAGKLVRFFAGSSAARGTTAPGSIPGPVSELPTPAAPLPTLPWAGAPEPFLPAPPGLVRKDGKRCKSPASWITGTTALPDTPRLLLTFVDVCVEKLWDWTVQRFGTVDYDPATNSLSNPSRPFAAAGATEPLAPVLHLGSPVVGDDGQLYLYSHACDAWFSGACAGGRVVLARVPLDQRNDPAAYRFLAGPGAGEPWTADPGQAANVLEGVRPMSAHVDRVGNRGLVMVEATSIGGTYRVWQAPDPVGPWEMRTDERQLDGCTAPEGVTDFCHALHVHPELSSPDRLTVTHYAAADQHVRVSTTDW